MRKENNAIIDEKLGELLVGFSKYEETYDSVFEETSKRVLHSNFTDAQTRNILRLLSISVVELENARKTLESILTHRCLV
jgi:hypothetical protein